MVRAPTRWWNFRSTSPSRSELTAESARSTPFTRSRSTRRVKLILSDRVKEDMLPSKRGSVVRPSPSSERRQRLPRRLLSSLNVLLARQEDWTPLSVASHSFSERRMLLRVAPSSDRTPLLFSLSLIESLFQYTLLPILIFYYNKFHYSHFH